MTYPVGGYPEDAANYDSLAAFAAKTQEEWETEMRGEQREPWDFTFLGFFQDLQQGKPFAVALLEAVAKGLGIPVGNWLTTEEIVAEINAWSADVGASIEDAGENIEGVIDSIIQGFHAWTQTGFTEADLTEFANTVGAALGTLSAMGLRLNRLEGENAVILEDFSTYPNNTNSLGSEWVQWYTGTGGGTLGIVNGYAIFNLQLDTAGKWAYAVYNTPVSSDFHKVSAAMSVPNEFFGVSQNILVARANPVPNGDHVFARLSWRKVEMGFVKGGAVTVLGAVDRLFTNGAIYTLDCTADRTWMLWENNTQILQVTDVGAASSLGASFRSTGFGTFAPNGVARPGVAGSFATFV